MSETRPVVMCPACNCFCAELVIDGDAVVGICCGSSCRTMGCGGHKDGLIWGRWRDRRKPVRGEGSTITFITVGGTSSELAAEIERAKHDLEGAGHNPWEGLPVNDEADHVALLLRGVLKGHPRSGLGLVALHGALGALVEMEREGE